MSWKCVVCQTKVHRKKPDQDNASRQAEKIPQSGRFMRDNSNKISIVFCSEAHELAFGLREKGRDHLADLFVKSRCDREWYVTDTKTVIDFDGTIREMRMFASRPKKAA